MIGDRTGGEGLPRWVPLPNYDQGKSMNEQGSSADGEKNMQIARPHTGWHNMRLFVDRASDHSAFIDDHHHRYVPVVIKDAEYRAAEQAYKRLYEAELDHLGGEFEAFSPDKHPSKWEEMSEELKTAYSAAKKERGGAEDVVIGTTTFTLMEDHCFHGDVTVVNSLPGPYDQARKTTITRRRGGRGPGISQQQQADEEQQKQQLGPEPVLAEMIVMWRLAPGDNVPSIRVKIAGPGYFSALFEPRTHMKRVRQKVFETEGLGVGGSKLQDVHDQRDGPTLPSFSVLACRACLRGLGAQTWVLTTRPCV